MGWGGCTIGCAAALLLALVPGAPAQASDSIRLTLMSPPSSVIYRGDDAAITLTSTKRVKGCRLLLSAQGGRTWSPVRTFSLQRGQALTLRVATTTWQAGDWRLRAECQSSAVTSSLKVLEPPRWAKGRISLAGATPSFDPEIQDYAARASAEAGTCTVPVSATMPRGLRVSVDGSPAASGAITRTVQLLPGQRFRITSMRAGETRTYSIRCLPEDFPRFTAAGRGTAEWYVGDLVFDSRSGTYVYALDRQGTPVWWAYQQQGNPVTVRAWSAAELTAIGHPGAYALSWFIGSRPVIDTLDGRRFAVPWVSDRHDLQPSGRGTLYAFRYIPRDCANNPAECVDMTAYGGTAADTVIDAEILELSLDGTVLWRWLSRDHIPVDWSERLLTKGFASAYRDDGSWDLVHINSVEAIGDDVLVSMRNIDALLRIDKETGAIEWKIGGTDSPESLQVLDASGAPLSEPALGGQHDARVLPDGTITTYDNGSLFDRLPRAIRYQVDEATRTATMVETVYHQQIVGGSPCCGGIRRLPNGNWVGSWGPIPIAGEVGPDGSPVLALDFDSRYGPYRLDPVETGIIPAVALRRAMDLAHPRRAGSTPAATPSAAAAAPRGTRGVGWMLALPSTVG